MAAEDLLPEQITTRSGEHAAVAVLLPEKPRPDLLALLETQGIHAIWPADTGFVDTAEGVLV